MKRSSAFMAAAVMAVMAGTMSMPAFAANYTKVSGTSTTFNKYFVMDADANVPAETFKYTIRAGSAQAADDGHMAILAGVNADTITIDDIKYDRNDTGSLQSTVQTGDTVVLDAGEAYVKKTATVDFSHVQFDEPGIYRYIITEDTTTKQGITYDTQKSEQYATNLGERILDVYVTDDGNGKLEVSEYVLHYGKDTDQVVRNDTSGSQDVSTQKAKIATKSDGYVNEFATQDLEFGKEVTGNQGSKDKYFKYDLTLTNLLPGDVYTVDVTTLGEAAPLANSATVYTADTMRTANTITDTNNNKTVLTADASGSVSHTFYLKDGQYVTVFSLPKDSVYTVVETKEDYTQTKGIAASISHDGKDHVAAQENATVLPEKTANNDPILTGYTNERQGVIPTGVLVSIAPYAAIAVAGGLGAGFAAKKKRKNEEEEEA